MIFRRHFHLALVLIFCLTGWVDPAHVAAQKKPRKLTFEQDVLPIFKARCFGCHSGVKPKAGLDLTTWENVLAGGGSGSIIRRAAAESSRLWERIAAGEMPPKGPPLSAQQKGVVRRWINDGALAGEGQNDDSATGAVSAKPRSFFISDEDRNFWSFRTPARSTPPPVRVGPVSEWGGVRIGIDAFVIANLEEKGLSLSSPASRVTLIRRAAYDLLGLPPTPSQVRRFLADTRPDAYERLIDRLLASPRYGERWGRHWLDLAGYADSAGILNEDRPLEFAWRYRDYVIAAMNIDKPYDRFLQEQIAGDELTDYWRHFENDPPLPPHVVEAVIATGYLRCAADSSRPDFSTIKNADALYFYPTINDTIKIVATSTMGLTLQCARCHDHMFDPISQEDFYRVQAIFMGAYRPTNWIPQMKRRIVEATKSQIEAAKKRGQEVDAKVAPLKKQLEKLCAESKDKPDFKLQEKKLRQQIAAQERRRYWFDEIRALYDLPGEVHTPLLRRGDPLTPGPPVSPGAPAILHQPAPFEWTRPTPGAKTSGRRLAMARWLTRPDHPLTARVMVNRLWLHHFGVGIVSTPDDFGRAGSPPSHPKLLDWLSVKFATDGWSLKKMHRLIMTSSAYRQRSVTNPAEHKLPQRIDPENRLLWRGRLRRLEAEPLRDAVLHVSGQLNSKMFGRPIPVSRRPGGEVVAGAGPESRRRSIYLKILRLTPLTFLNAFDQPVMETNCLRRSRSTVSTQALTLLNSDMMVAAANQFARRVDHNDSQEIVSRAVWLAFSRPPTPHEQTTLSSFIVEQTRRYEGQRKSPSEAKRLAVADLCHMLLSSNEFLYID